MSTLPARIRAFVSRTSRSVVARWPTALLAAGAVATAIYVIVYPFLLATFPPITDLPFHAAEASILRHYFDPHYHFREQFELHFFDVPYAAMYVLGAFFAFFMPITWAIKLTAIVLLSMLPVGLAVLFHGMKKSPLWGMLGLGPTWCMLTHWGFLNFLGAIGLFAAVVGLTLRVVDAPTRRRQWLLTLALLAVFFTHIYRFPFAVAAVVGVTLFMYPATRRYRPVLLPLAVSAMTYVLWVLVRRPGLSSNTGRLALHTERLAEIPGYLFSGFVGGEELAAGRQMLAVYCVLFVLCAAVFFAQGRHRHRGGRDLLWGAGITLLPIALGAVFLLAYLVLPMEMGIWWFVYPREVTTAAYLALGAMPDLPRQWWLRAPMLAAVALVTGRLGFVTASHWYDFERSNADFEQILKSIPQAPKLMYLIFDHSGSARRVTPYIHMPAWVQAQKGGWLSFHFVGWDVHPIRYRPAGPDVPPPTPLRWEWTPERFRVQTHGAFFDTFLVRSSRPVDSLFAPDPSIHPAAHAGRWWLYRREKSAPPGSADPG